MEGEFNKLLPSLESAGGKTRQGAADAFARRALPFTRKWGFEIGANIVPRAGGGFSVDDVTLGYFGGVDIPHNLAAVADVHTHPGSAAGFSGFVQYSKDRGLYRYNGDMNTNYGRNIDGYVFRVSGGAWRFNQGTFRSDLTSAMKNGTTIDSRWSRYVEQIR